ncbi:hypothetical protein BDM02DRAFT_1619950 [Thelephora ganbajun]|uniref:Uncharacterized protein n=1 Tax=Thelephora ganbajun TaxID=370292 RepID=A0ACB6ZWE4_THEGA|nr:hypothetical protein BDM02DRAFT_1619950 [Thelephora ganbajun]
MSNLIDEGDGVSCSSHIKYPPRGCIKFRSTDTRTSHTDHVERSLGVVVSNFGSQSLSKPWRTRRIKNQSLAFALDSAVKTGVLVVHYNQSPKMSFRSSKGTRFPYTSSFHPTSQTCYTSKRARLIHQAVTADDQGCSDHILILESIQNNCLFPSAVKGGDAMVFHQSYVSSYSPVVDHVHY